jgi:hypothetical protein
VWFGSTRGAVEWRDGVFRYRQGPRWLPGDDVRDLVVDGDGNVVLATDAGLGWIEARSMTLADKARKYEEEIERSIARTEYGFVSTADLGTPGDVSTAVRTDSDNDGLWTAMYGAAQCFAYAHDGSAEAKRRADRAFRALAFLQEVTQGGGHAPPPGFPASTSMSSVYCGMPLTGSLRAAASTWIPRMCHRPNLRPRARTPIAMSLRPPGKRSGAGTGRPKPSRCCTDDPLGSHEFDQPPSTTKSTKPPIRASGLAAKSAASAGSEVAFRSAGA